MAHVIAAAGFPGQFQIPFYLAPFTLGTNALVTMLLAVAAVVDVTSVQERIVLAVSGQNDVLAGGGLHGPAHHFFTLHAAAVVGESYASALQGLEIYQFLAFPAHGDGAVGKDGDDGIFLNGFQLQVQMLQAVGNRVQVRHGANQRVAASRRGLGPGKDGLFPGLARLAQVHVHIAECR